MSKLPEAPGVARLPMVLEKIISGGQTGVDRGALDAALAERFPLGGWCPADRSAEDGVIDGRYPLTPLPGAGYPERTRQNVLDSDGTLVLFDGALSGGVLSGGTELTARTARDNGKPWLEIDASRVSVARAVGKIHGWIEEHGIKTLNVAGPRASGWREGYEYASQVIRALLRLRN